ncbi:choice-of-anchor E domain-containing protein [Phycisphaeraceae bacterium D3-23]
MAYLTHSSPMSTMAAVALLGAAPTVLLAGGAEAQQDILVRFGTAGGSPGLPAIADVFIPQGQLSPLSTTAQEQSSVGLGLPKFDPAWGTLDSVSLEIAPQVLNTWEITIGGGSADGEVTSSISVSVNIPQNTGPDVSGLLFSDSWGGFADNAAVDGWFSSTTVADSGSDYQIPSPIVMGVGPVGTTAAYTGGGMFTVDMETTVSALLNHNRFNHGGGDRDHHAEIAPVSTNFAWVEYQFDSTSLLAGDVDLDGDVDADDLAIVDGNFGQALPFWNEGDLNADGLVGKPDRLIVNANMGAGGTRSSSVPEPGALSLLALGGAALLRRRR